MQSKIFFSRHPRRINQVMHEICEYAGEERVVETLFLMFSHKIRQHKALFENMFVNLVDKPTEKKLKIVVFMVLVEDLKFDTESILEAYQIKPTVIFKRCNIATELIDNDPICFEFYQKCTKIVSFLKNFKENKNAENRSDNRPTIGGGGRQNR